MLDILPGKILRPSQDTNSDSWPARGKTQMLEHWKKKAVFSVQSRLLSTVSKAKFCCPGFLSDMHTHTHASPTQQREGETSGIDDRMRWLSFHHERMKGTERSPGELWSPARCARELGVKGPQILSRHVLLSLLPFSHLFSHKLSSSCPLLYQEQQTLPSPLHTAPAKPPS